jgi:hypothetical protein
MKKGINCPTPKILKEESFENVERTYSHDLRDLSQHF